MWPRLVSLHVLLLSCTAVRAEHAPGAWWQVGAMYQIYPRSFKDSDGDGIGDLKGIMQELPYLKQLGIGFIWISPFNLSPMRDFGYDVTDYRQIDPVFGTLDDLKKLIEAAYVLGLRVVMDFVPNHTSNESEWFLESRSSKTNPKRDWYIWHPGKLLPNGTRVPPNNWVGRFEHSLGSAWTWDELTEEYYYHAFGDFQPDLNYRNPAVLAAVKDVMRFYLEMGIDGLRIDSVPFLLEDPELQDEIVKPGCTGPLWSCMDHRQTQDYEGIHGIIRDWRKLVDEFGDRALFGEIHAPDNDVVMSYYGTPSQPEFHIAFNFLLIGVPLEPVRDLTNSTVVQDTIRQFADGKPAWAHGSWVLSSHDNARVMDRTKNNTALTVALYALQDLLPGTPTIYYGEEIGMRDLYIPYQDCKDPQALNNPDRFAVIGRDPARTPFQWDASPQAGFSSNSSTWLPINPNQASVNVKAQEGDPWSALSVMRSSLQFRKDFPELPLGNITHVPRNVPDGLVFVQYSVSAAAADVVMVIAANLGCQEKVTFDMQYLLADRECCIETSPWWRAFSTRPEHGQEWVSPRQVRLEPCEVVVLMEPPKAQASDVSRYFLAGKLGMEQQRQQSVITAPQLTIFTAVFLSVGVLLTFACLYRRARFGTVTGAQQEFCRAHTGTATSEAAPFDTAQQDFFL